jgi:outer membrane protein insertion porin family
LFRTVSVEPLPPEDALERDVSVRVVERAPGRFAWGAGYNSRDGLGLAGELTYDNLSGMARQARLRGRINLKPGEFVPDQYLGGVGFREPRLADSMWAFETNVIGERSTKSVDKFNIEHVSLVTSFNRPVLPQVKGGLEWEVDRGNVFDVADDAVLVPEDEGWSWTVALSPFLVYDARDDPFSPGEGIFESIRFRWSLPELSDSHFIKLSAQHSHFISVVDDIVFVYVLRGGWARSLDGGYTVPIRERFFLGGRSTVRGFSEDSIGPRGEKGNQQGGDLSLNTNVELRFPLWYGFGGAFFCDGGGLYLQKEPISIDDFRRSAGVSLRYLTPLGPLSLDYGIKLDRRSGEDFDKFHFSVGAKF